MKKMFLLVGAAIGFFLGSRAGREPYDQLEQAARRLAKRPEVKRATKSVTRAVQEHGEDVTKSVKAKAHSLAGSGSNGST